MGGVERGGDREALRGWEEGRGLLQGQRPGSALSLHWPWGRPELRITWEGLPVSGRVGLLLPQDDPLPKVISGTQKRWVQREAVWPRIGRFLCTRGRALSPG